MDTNAIWKTLSRSEKQEDAVDWWLLVLVLLE